MKDPIPKSLFDKLACPKCKGDLAYNKDKDGLYCKKCKKNYPIKEGIPVFI